MTDTSVTMISKIYTGIRREPNHEKNYFTEGIIEDSSGEIYCLAKWRTDERTSYFHLIHINVENNGNITSHIVAKNRSLGGDYEYPAIRSNDIIWVPYSVNYQNVSEHEWILSVPLKNATNETDFG